MPVLTDATDHASAGFGDELETDEGWAKYNRHYWLRDYRGFLEFFFAADVHRAALDQADRGLRRLGPGHDPGDADPDRARRRAGPRRDGAGRGALPRRRAARSSWSTAAHDAVVPFARGAAGRRADRRRARPLRGLRPRAPGPRPRPRQPAAARVRASASRAGRRRARGPGRASLARPQRALFVSSPIGLGHAWRDIAIADELRRAVAGPRDRLARAGAGHDGARERGESDPPGERRARRARRRTSITRRASTTCTCSRRCGGMDEIFCANFMVFADLVREEPFDVWIARRGLGGRPLPAREPGAQDRAVRVADRFRRLPADAGRAASARRSLTADYNAEMIEHVERHPSVRDRAIFVGDPDDVVPDSVRPRACRGSATGRSATSASPATCPASTRARWPTATALRAQLGYGDDAGVPRLGRRLGRRRAAAAARDRRAPARARPRPRPARWSSSRGRGSTRRACRARRASRSAATSTSCTAISRPATSRSCRAG